MLIFNFFFLLRQYNPIFTHFSDRTKKKKLSFQSYIITNGYANRTVRLNVFTQAMNLVVNPLQTRYYRYHVNSIIKTEQKILPNIGNVMLICNDFVDNPTRTLEIQKQTAIFGILSRYQKRIYAI